jgi:hypothetical protein
MKQKLCLLVVGFLAGGSIVFLLSHYAAADERTLARLYPASLGLGIFHDLRVLTAIQSNDIPYATSLLQQRIDSNVNSLMALEKAKILDEHTRKALAAGQGALRTQ